MSLFEMINVCIMAYANYLRDVKGIQFDFKKIKKKDIIIVKGVQSLLKSYNNGEWNKIMRQFKKDPKNMFGLTDAIAMANKIPGINVSNSATGAISGNISTGATIGLSVLGIVLLLLSIRLLIYFFYSRAAKIDNYVSTQKEFLSFDMSNDNGTEKGVESRKKMLNFLDRTSSFIENKIFKADNEAKKELSVSNKDNFNKSDFDKAGINNTDKIELF
jgi:hypothetical protein